MEQIVVVQLRISDGSTHPVQCRGIVKNPLIPGQVILVQCIDPVPTQFGEVHDGNWSVSTNDIANYVVGRIEEELEEDEDTEEVNNPALEQQGA
jgi:hypothetical protein